MSLQGQKLLHFGAQAPLLSFISVHTVGPSMANILDASLIFAQSKVKFITSMPNQAHFLIAIHSIGPVPGDVLTWEYAQVCVTVCVPVEAGDWPSLSSSVAFHLIFLRHRLSSLKLERVNLAPLVGQ